MSYILVVVDMQTSFEAARYASVIRNCKREISKAVRDRAPIIFLEYSGREGTNSALLSLTKNYNNVFIGVKSADDGSLQVSNIISDNNLPKTNFKVCGVNTDYCVYDTVDGLNYRFKNAKINVIGDACGSNYNHNLGMQKIKNIANVTVTHIY